MQQLSGQISPPTLAYLLFSCCSDKRCCILGFIEAARSSKQSSSHQWLSELKACCDRQQPWCNALTGINVCTLRCRVLEGGYNAALVCAHEKRWRWLCENWKHKKKRTCSLKCTPCFRSSPLHSCGLVRVKRLCDCCFCHSNNGLCAGDHEDFVRSVYTHFRFWT